MYRTGCRAGRRQGEPSVVTCSAIYSQKTVITIFTCTVTVIHYFPFSFFLLFPFLSFLPLLFCLCSSTCWKQCQHSVSSSLLLLFSVRAGSAQRPSPLRTTSEDHGSLKTKDQFSNPDKDKGARKKSSDSGEEVDKDFILIWVSNNNKYFC